MLGRIRLSPAGVSRVMTPLSLPGLPRWERSVPEGVGAVQGLAGTTRTASRMKWEREGSPVEVHPMPRLTVPGGKEKVLM